MLDDEPKKKGLSFARKQDGNSILRSWKHDPNISHGTLSKMIQKMLKKLSKTCWDTLYSGLPIGQDGARATLPIPK